MRIAWMFVGALFAAGACSESGGSSNPAQSTGGSGGTYSDGGGAGHGAGGATPDPFETCLEATSEDDCASIVLPTLENCDDCWHACVWTTIHEVEYEENSCSYGDSMPACRFVRGGEESSYSLADHCRSFGDTNGNAFFQEVGTNVLLAYLNEGFLDGFRRCGSEGAPAECSCFCEEGYPDAECLDIEQAWRSGVASGMVECPGVPIHRDREVTCTEDVGGCESSDDCAAGEACVCAHVGGIIRESQCVPADCMTSADCAEGDVCAIAYDGSGDVCGASRLACQQTYNLCNGDRCDQLELCGFDEEGDEFVCQDMGSCY